VSVQTWGIRGESQARNPKVFVHSRQGIASHRGKESLQVALLFFCHLKQYFAASATYWFQASGNLLLPFLPPIAKILSALSS
jgi:hypothetical protein